MTSRANPGKIKGGRWTVARFFLISTAYTSAWLCVSSNLGYYAKVFGPQSLLQVHHHWHVTPPPARGPERPPSD
jgi:hypothetical protein